MQFGARPLKRAIQKYLEDEMAELIIRASVGEGDKIVVDFNKDEQKIVTSVQKEDRNKSFLPVIKSKCQIEPIWHFCLYRNVKRIIITLKI